MAARTWVSWSSGKDCCLALHRLLEDPGVEVTALLTTLNGEAGRVAMHAVRRELVRAQADRLGLPLVEVDLPWPCTNADYEQRMGEVVRRAAAEGVQQIAFGDLALADVRAYRERMLAGTGITPSFPLWGEPTDRLAQELLDRGLRATVTCVDPSAVPEELAGRAFDADLLASLPAAADPCGEHGELHTFVHHAPAFREPIEVEVGEVVRRDGFVFCDLLPAAAAG